MFRGTVTLGKVKACRGGPTRWDGHVKPFARHRSPVSVAGVALAIQTLCASAPPALAQAAEGRSEARVLFNGGGDPTSRRVTVETASREAQYAIRSCEDRAALTCVADALTRYAAALHQIADERRRHAHAVYKAQ